jgi:hypothetical protein
MTTGRKAERPRSGSGATKDGTLRIEKRRRIELVGDLSTHSRIFSYLIHILIQRLDRSRREVYAGDLDLASISEAIGLFASEGLMRDERWREEHRSFDKRLGLDGQRVTNILSIAEATGIPRETTRRKIKKLKELGVLTEIGPSQYVTTPGFLQQPDIKVRYENAVNDVLRFINRALEQGVFRVSGDDE